MKIRVKDLKKIISETMNKKSLNEQIRLSDDSMDDQIDSLLIGFESEASENENGETQAQYQESHFFDRFMNKILLEKDEENDAPADPPPPPEDLTSDNSDIQGNQALAPPKGKINIDQFSKKVGRLIKNYQNLLDPKTVIYARAKNLLIQNYNEEAAEEFSNILSTKFGINLDNNQEENPVPPPAVGSRVNLG